MGLYSYFRKHNETGATEPVDVEEGAAETPAETAPAAQQPAARPTPADPFAVDQAAFAKLRADFEAGKAAIAESQAVIADLKAKDLASRVSGAKAAGVAFATSLQTAGKILPAGAKGAADLHAFASLHAAGLPTEGLDPVSALAELEKGLVKHGLTGHALAETPAALTRLDNGSKADDGKPSIERQIAILEKHPDGAKAAALLRQSAARN